MKGADVLLTGGTIAAGAWAGSTLAAVPGAVVGGLLGLLIGAVVALAGIRIGVAVPVIVGGLAGGILGRSIVHALCLPGECAAAETTAALLTGLGSFVGVGLVAALVTRSFEEYRESRTAQRDTGHRAPDTGEG